MTDPFVIDGPTCLSFSGGRTSGYMLWRTVRANTPEAIKEWLRVIFCNTGKEEEATLRFVEECGERWGVPITWLEYVQGGLFTTTSMSYARRNGEPFEAVIEQRGGVLPNRVSRFCSSELKTRTMHRYLRSIGWTEWDTFIGIRADEPRRVAKFRANPHPEGKFEEVHMPLALAGIGAAAVGTFWRSIGFDLGLPNINGKTLHGNCDLCYLKPAHQVLSLIAEKPSRAVWWAEQEKKAEAVATGNACRFRDDRPSYAAMAQFAADQRDAFGHDEEAIPCYCGD
jgi:3'-phosphoadenosine 5'-phosphosulfate sulfotransferase (PAPS reductase)/FAD synthetase